jgi:hypothetical protein
LTKQWNQTRNGAGMISMHDQSQTSVDTGVESLHALAAATTRYYESGPEHFEEARAEYETLLTRFNSSRSADASVIEPPM